MSKVSINAVLFTILLITSNIGYAQFGGGNCATQNAGDSCQDFADLEACIQADCNANCTDADGMPMGCTRVLTGGTTTCRTGNEPNNSGPAGTYPIGTYSCKPTPTPTPSPSPSPSPSPKPSPSPTVSPVPTSFPEPFPSGDPTFGGGGSFPPVCTKGTCGPGGGCKSGNCYGSSQDGKPTCSGGVCKPPPGGPSGPGGKNGDKKMSDAAKCLALKTGEKIFWDICKKDPDCKALKTVIDAGKCFDAVCKDNPGWNYDACVSSFCTAVGKSHPALAVTCKSYGWAKIFRDCVLIPVIDETVTAICELGHAIDHARDPLPPTICVTNGKNSPFKSPSAKKGACYRCCSKSTDSSKCFDACDKAFSQGVFD